MRTRLRRLPGLVAALAAVAAATGLVRRPTGEPVRVVTPRGQPAELAGSGLYAHDTVFTAAGNTAQVVGPIAGFGVLGAVGAWLLTRLLRAVPAARPVPPSEVPHEHVHV
ncbi:hypothetical protein [Geodermatophilus sp. SYSU D01036]